jgi:hypothetical protein
MKYTEDISDLSIEELIILFNNIPDAFYSQKNNVYREILKKSPYWCPPDE